MSKFRKLTDEEVRRFLLAMSLLSYVLCVLSVFDLHEPHSTGRWSQLLLFFYQNFGPYSIPVFWGIGGSFLLFKALKKNVTRE